MLENEHVASGNPEKKSRQYSTFYVGDLFFGVEVSKVQELLRYQEITAVPLAPAVIQGLINLRGQIVTAVDMRCKLQLPGREGGALPMNIVVRSDEGAVSLLVDEVGDVLEPANDAHEPPPATMPVWEKEIVESVCKLEGKLLLVLDTTRLQQSCAEEVFRSSGEPC